MSATVPYGFRSLLECLCRAVVLAQPSDINKFLFQYFSELDKFKTSNPEPDPKELVFNFEEHLDLCQQINE
uniref:RIIa domain-containing protein n=1 Tax=Kryptolebias marmoratus TaxID=37003 RepID=A0A3Q3BBB0_KRYMA